MSTYQQRRAVHEASEPPDDLRAVLTFWTPAEHEALRALPRLYAAVGRPMESISDALRTAVREVVERLRGSQGTQGAGA